MSRVIFVTGTDTGVGKTLLTALLLRHLRRSGVRALAVKPFCSGGRADVELLGAIQDGEVPVGQINPYFFREPVAPLVATRRHGRPEIELSAVIDRIRTLSERCDCLLVEGAGGVLVPLGKGFAVGDLIASLNCETIVVARDRLGTINHTCLTVEALRARGVRRIQVVLMRAGNADASRRDNAGMIRELVAPARVWTFPSVGGWNGSAHAIRRLEKKFKKTLAQISDSATFTARSLEHVRNRAVGPSDCDEK